MLRLGWLNPKNAQRVETSFCLWHGMFGGLKKMQNEVKHSVLRVGNCGREYADERHSVVRDFWHEHTNNCKGHMPADT